MKICQKSTLSILLIILLCAVSYAATLSIIMDSENEVTNETLAGFDKYFSDKGGSGSFSKFVLDKQPADELSRKINGANNTVVFVIGKKSLDFAITEFASKIPVVFTLVADYQQNAGQKVTGIILIVPSSKKAAVMKESLPGMNRLGVIYSSAYRPKIDEIRAALEQNGIKYVENVIESDKDFVGAIKQVFQAVDYFMIVPDNNIYYSTTIKLLLLESVKNNIPLIGLNKSFTKSGAIMSVECDYADMGMQGGQLAERIMKGEAPNSIPIQTPRKVSVSVNVGVATKMGKKISQDVIAKSAAVFQ